ALQQAPGRGRGPRRGRQSQPPLVEPDVARHIQLIARLLRLVALSGHAARLRRLRLLRSAVLRLPGAVLPLRTLVATRPRRPSGRRRVAPVIDEGPEFTRHCERSEAIPLRIPLIRWGLLRRSAPRNDSL